MLFDAGGAGRKALRCHICYYIAYDRELQAPSCALEPEALPGRLHRTTPSRGHADILPGLV